MKIGARQQWKVLLVIGSVLLLGSSTVRLVVVSRNVRGLSSFLSFPSIPFSASSSFPLLNFHPFPPLFDDDISPVPLLNTTILYYSTSTSPRGGGDSLSLSNQSSLSSFDRARKRRKLPAEEVCFSPPPPPLLLPSPSLPPVFHEGMLMTHAPLRSPYFRERLSPRPNPPFLLLHARLIELSSLSPIRPKWEEVHVGGEGNSPCHSWYSYQRGLFMQQRLFLMLQLHLLEAYT